MADLTEALTLRKYNIEVKPVTTETGAESDIKFVKCTSSNPLKILLNPNFKKMSEVDRKRTISVDKRYMVPGPN